MSDSQTTHIRVWALSEVVTILCLLVILRLAEVDGRRVSHGLRAIAKFPRQANVNKYFQGNSSKDNNLNIYNRQQYREIQMILLSDWYQRKGRKNIRDITNGTSHLDRLCKQCHRHKHSKRIKERERSNDEQIRFPVKVPIKYGYRHDYQLELYRNSTDISIPGEIENCTIISAFLSKGENLKFVSRKAKDLSCNSGDLARMFRTLENLGNVDFARQNHRARVMRKWRHLACRLYQNFMNCWKESSPSANIIPLPQGHTMYNYVEKTKANEERRQAVSVNTEAVHISNSSHVDFLNLMVGYDSEYTDDFQMWFY